MAKGDGYLSVAIKSVQTEAETKELYEAVKAQLTKMSSQQVHKLFMGSATGSGGPLPHAFTGLRALLDADKWKFGTVHRNKTTDERVMVVGYRKVTGLRYDRGTKRGWVTGVGDTVEDWFDYWEAEPDEK